MKNNSFLFMDNYALHVHVVFKFYVFGDYNRSNIKDGLLVNNKEVNNA